MGKYTRGMVARASIIHVATLWAVGIVVAVVPGLASSAPSGAEPPWLGVAISDGVHGVRVDEVIADTPADGAGLLPGDEITTVAGARVTTVAELQNAVASRRIADRVVLGVWRDERVIALAVTLGPRLGPGEILYRRLVGKPAPSFDATVVAGSESGRLEHLRGRALVIAFFATECKECADMHERLSRLADARARDGLVVLAVSNEPHRALESWARRMVPSFTLLHDSYGEMVRSFRVDTVPAIVVVSRDGAIAYAGAGEPSVLEHAILVAERALRGARSARTR